MKFTSEANDITNNSLRITGAVYHAHSTTYIAIYKKKGMVFFFQISLITAITATKEGENCYSIQIKKVKQKVCYQKQSVEVLYVGT